MANDKSVWLSMPKEATATVPGSMSASPTQWNLRAADAAVLNNVHKKKKSKKISPFLNS